VIHKIPQQFPKIRWGFIEAGSSWIPNAMYNLERRLKKPGENNRISYELRGNLMREFNFFVTCQVDEDLPYVLQYAGEDNIIVGSDYCHADQSAERDFQMLLRARADKGELSHSVVDKILYDNPRRLYGL
jgi:predicted TIM-barrel fold metal-dependent hydrolase